MHHWFRTAFFSPFLSTRSVCVYYVKAAGRMTCLSLVLTQVKRFPFFSGGRFHSSEGVLRVLLMCSRDRFFSQFTFLFAFLFRVCTALMCSSLFNENEPLCAFRPLRRSAVLKIWSAFDLRNVNDLLSNVDFATVRVSIDAFEIVKQWIKYWPQWWKQLFKMISYLYIIFKNKYFNNCYFFVPLNPLKALPLNSLQEKHLVS